MAFTNDLMLDKLRILYPSVAPTLNDLLDAFWSEQGRQMAGWSQNDFFRAIGGSGADFNDMINSWWSEAPEHAWSLLTETGFKLLNEFGGEFWLQEVSGFCLLQETGDRFLNEDSGEMKLEITSWLMRAEDNSRLMAENGDTLRLQSANISI